MQFSQEEKNLLKFSLEFLIESLNVIPSKKFKRQNLNKVIMLSDCKNLLSKIN